MTTGPDGEGVAAFLDELAGVFASLPVGSVTSTLPGLGREVADLFTRAAEAIRNPPEAPLSDAESRARNALSALTADQRDALAAAIAAGH